MKIRVEIKLMTKTPPAKAVSYIFLMVDFDKDIY